MALAPGVYARNRMFDLFTLPAVQRAKTRAGILRGLVLQLGRATTLTVATEGNRGGEPVVVLRYAIAGIRLHRVVELSEAELSALRLLAARANVHVLAPEPNDRTVVDLALARLIDLEAPKTTTRAPSPSWPPPPRRFPE
jgi:hypothetical protein